MFGLRDHIGFKPRDLPASASQMVGDKSLFYLCVYVVCSMCVYACVHVCVHPGACGNQKMALDSLELELKAVLNYPMWILGSEFGFSGRTGSAPES